MFSWKSKFKLLEYIIWRLNRLQQTPLFVDISDQKQMSTVTTLSIMSNVHVILVLNFRAVWKPQLQE